MIAPRFALSSFNPFSTFLIYLYSQIQGFGVLPGGGSDELMLPSFTDPVVITIIINNVGKQVGSSGFNF